MGNHKFSQVSRNDIKENKTNQRLEEKAVLVSAGKCLPQSSSDRCYIANEPLEEDPEEERSEVEEDPEEKPSEVEEDPEEESVEEIGNKLEKEPRDDLEEDPEEDPIEELEEEPIKVLLEQIEEPSECDAQSYFTTATMGVKNQLKMRWKHLQLNATQALILTIHTRRGHWMHQLVSQLSCRVISHKRNVGKRNP